LVVPLNILKPSADSLLVFAVKAKVIEETVAGSPLELKYTGNVEEPLLAHYCI
jgi:hypothetical protein